MKKIYIIFLIFLSGCCIKEKTIYLSDKQIVDKRMNDRRKMAINAIKYSQELKEWYFVNEKKDYSCGLMEDSLAVYGSCRTYEIFDYNRYFLGYFSYYTTLKKLKKKWKNKPLPEYLKKAYLNNLYIQIKR